MADKLKPGGRNQTAVLSDEERTRYGRELLKLTRRVKPEVLKNKIINQDLFEALDFFPSDFVDLMFIDPPYNLTKNFGTLSFKEMSEAAYEDWFSSWFPRLLPLLKPTASVYICGDWRSSGAIQSVAGKNLVIRNRITWEREKGRGAKSNWKNCSEDIWFCTVSKHFHFNADAVKLRRRVIAPYRDSGGKPRDWSETAEGNFRLTSPSNLWTDLTVPFWSMPENTSHSTQKPEKLLAKIILASSREGDFVFDPFLGSGTTAVTAEKLGRLYCGVEQDNEYCCLAAKRLEKAALDKTIQGYSNGVFLERNMSAPVPSKSEAGNREERGGEVSARQLDIGLDV